jgi:hypothetical protein
MSVPPSLAGRYEIRLGLRMLGHTSYLPAYEDGTDSVLKHRHIKFRRREITQKKAYNIQNTA